MCKQSGCKINMAREPILSSDNTIMNKAIISGSVDQILLAKVIFVLLLFLLNLFDFLLFLILKGVDK